MMEKKSIALTIMALGKMTFSNGLFWPVLVGKSRHAHRDILPNRPQQCHAVYALHKRIGGISTVAQGSTIFFHGSVPYFYGFKDHFKTISYFLPERD